VGFRLFYWAKVFVRQIDGDDREHDGKSVGHRRGNNEFKSNYFAGHREILALTSPSARMPPSAESGKRAERHALKPSLEAVAKEARHPRRAQVQGGCD
jgi:hypothetical protein